MCHHVEAESTDQVAEVVQGEARRLFDVVHEATRGGHHNVRLDMQTVRAESGQGELTCTRTYILIVMLANTVTVK